MRPRSIQSVPGLDDPKVAPFERRQRFAGRMIRVPRAEAEKETRGLIPQSLVEGK